METYRFFPEEDQRGKSLGVPVMRWYDPEDDESTDYFVIDSYPELARVNLVKVQIADEKHYQFEAIDSEIVPAYSKQALEDPYWTNLGWAANVADLCPKCEEEPIMADDYICEHCRFG